MRYLLIAILVAGCADKASVESLRRENLELKERVAKLEAATAKPSPDAKPAAAPKKDDVPEATAITGSAALVAAIDRHIEGFDRSTGLKYDEMLDEHGRIRDLKSVASTVKAKFASRGAEGEWRLLAEWLGIPATPRS
jgi:hypothetical protein